MKLPSCSKFITLDLSFQVATSAGIEPQWACDSRCKWHQLDCKAWKALNCSEEGRFARCMGFPSAADAGPCIAAVAGCFPVAAAGPVPYGACLGVACGSAGVAHGHRCAKESGLLD